MNSFTFRMQTYDKKMIKTSDTKKYVWIVKNILQKSLVDWKRMRIFADEDNLNHFIIN